LDGRRNRNRFLPGDELHSELGTHAGREGDVVRRLDDPKADPGSRQQFATAR
jgi:hypothetical protein